MTSVKREERRAQCDMMALIDAAIGVTIATPARHSH
jgi:hypothetical protein